MDRQLSLIRQSKGDPALAPLLCSLCSDRSSSMRLEAYGAMGSYVSVLSTQSLLSVLPDLLPHLLLSRYWGPEFQRWPSQNTWKNLVTRLDGLTEFGTEEETSEVVSPFLQAVSNGMALAAGTAPRGMTVSPSAAAAMAPGPQGGSRSGKLLLHQHVEDLGLFYIDRLHSALLSLRECCSTTDSPMNTSAHPPSIELSYVVMEAEALVNCTSELVGKGPRGGVRRHIKKLLGACWPFQWSLKSHLIVSEETLKPEASHSLPLSTLSSPRSRSSLLASLCDCAIVCCGKMLSTFPDEFTEEELSRAVVEWVDSDMIFHRWEDRPLREHVAFSTGFVIATSPQHLQARLAPGLSRVIQTRLGGQRLSLEAVLHIFGAERYGEAHFSTAACTVMEVEGALYFLRELSAVDPQAASPLIPCLCTLAQKSLDVHRESIINSLPSISELHALPLLQILWRCTPDIARSLGKLETRKHLELLLPPLYATASLPTPSVPLQCDKPYDRSVAIRLAQEVRDARATAFDCAATLSSLLGKEVFDPPLKRTMG